MSIQSRSRERGSALVEFLLCFALFWVPLFFGSLVIGLNLIREIQVTQICRDAGHMYSFGTDFSLAGNQTLLAELAPNLNLSSANPGNAYIVFSTVTFVDASACLSGTGKSTCPNLNKAVITRRIVIGNSAVHPLSNIGNPASTIIGSGGVIKPSDYTTDATAVAPAFLNLISLSSSSQNSYVTEMWASSSDLNIWGPLGNVQPSARFFF